MSASVSRVLAAGLFVLGLLAPHLAFATDFFVYPATFKAVVQMVTNDDVVVNRKLGNTELINLALGRPLATKVDKKTEILAGAGSYADHANESKLIVFDPSQNGVNQIKAVVGTLSALEFNNAYLPSKSQGTGFGTATFPATTLGNPGQNGFLLSTIQGGGAGSGPHDPFIDGPHKISGKGDCHGHVKFNYTDATGTHQFDGFVLKCQGKVSGKAIGGFTQ
ncbi:MAG: hypothetical protein ABIR79_24145 [Candidatus Binatia bacterium]